MKGKVLDVQKRKAHVLGANFKVIKCGEHRSCPDGESRLQRAEAKFGRGSARQIGKAIVAIRSHQNQRSEYDQSLPITKNKGPYISQGQEFNQK